jgi:hypothetical protein
LILISYIFSIWDQNKSLTQLDLSHNYLRAVTSDLVDGLPSLESLDLTDNDISLVESGALTNLPKLIHLSLTGKSIANLYYILYSAAFSPHPIHPDGWGLVEDIRRLSFSSAGLTSIINISNKGNSIYISQQATFSLPTRPLFLCGGRKDSLALAGRRICFPNGVVVVRPLFSFLIILFCARPRFHNAKAADVSKHIPISFGLVLSPLSKQMQFSNPAAAGS